MPFDYSPFSIGRLPLVRFGAGRIGELPAIVAPYGRRGVLVTGSASLAASGTEDRLLAELRRASVSMEIVRIPSEPDPALIDGAVAALAPGRPRFVVAAGGGSALDAGKAIAGLLPSGRPVMDFLEGVGAGHRYPGPALPMIAVPTTAGTGSEATRNAVIGVSGRGGFKKSFRDEQLVPAVALVDPDLLATCPPPVVAANGMDALTQLLEGYVSVRASPFTDALAEKGLGAVRRGLMPMYESDAADTAARARMAWAALASGMVLAQAGLGSVHGLAAPLGAFFALPHGVACGTLVAAATDVNIAALAVRDPEGRALGRYRRAAELLLGRHFRDQREGCAALVALLAEWTERLGIDRLSRYGVVDADVPTLVANARGNSMKTNPVELTDEEVARLVRTRL